MGNDAIVTVDHVSMKFNLSSEKFDSFKEYVIKSIKRQEKTGKEIQFFFTPPLCFPKYYYRIITKWEKSTQSGG